MNKYRAKRMLQEVFEKIRSVPDGTLRNLSMKRWSVGLASWLNGDFNSVAQQCDKISARLDETGNFRNQEALLTRLLQPASYGVPPVRNEGSKPVDAAAWRSGYQGLGPAVESSNSSNRVIPRECSSGSGLENWAHSD